MPRTDTTISSILSAFTTTLDSLRALRSRRHHRKRVLKAPRGGCVPVEPAPADEDALSHSLRRGAGDVQREYERHYRDRGEGFAAGDHLAHASLSRTLAKLNARLVAIVGALMHRPPKSTPDYRSLASIADISRAEALDALESLSRRISAPPVSAPPPGPAPLPTPPPSTSPVVIEPDTTPTHTNTHPRRRPARLTPPRRGVRNSPPYPLTPPPTTVRRITLPTSPTPQLALVRPAPTPPRSREHTPQTTNSPRSRDATPQQGSSTPRGTPRPSPRRRDTPPSRGTPHDRTSPPSNGTPLDRDLSVILTTPSPRNTPPPAYTAFALPASPPAELPATPVPTPAPAPLPTPVAVGGEGRRRRSGEEEGGWRRGSREEGGRRRGSREADQEGASPLPAPVPAPAAVRPPPPPPPANPPRRARVSAPPRAEESCYAATLRKTRPESQYTFASDSTKLGEIPMGRWAVAWDWEEMERGNREAREMGLRVDGGGRGDGERREGRGWRLWR
ncbi:hypothetical protein EJ06DRAFT_582636 [Trichodelitschia bisporula]|uniref:Uncharacterized protein n=1 Tax=Trichodelitschia bisporula TaxID=703511 RepID=A0A6G1HVI6_9PEZI|nr:hypothetical protein EJ06DRAFT_582636 [Trichodelitschia bisporula]